MSSARRNFIVAYVLLVLVPLVGLAGVLRAGRGLKAPISVEGVWKIDSAAGTASEKQVSEESGSAPCGLSDAALSNSSLLISQSGKSLQLTFGLEQSNPGQNSFAQTSFAPSNAAPRNHAQAVALGVLDGETLQANISFSDGAAKADCGNAQPLALTAKIDPNSEPRSLSGMLRVEGCESCALVPFHAVRQPRIRTEGTR